MQATPERGVERSPLWMYLRWKIRDLTEGLSLAEEVDKGVEMGEELTGAAEHFLEGRFLAVGEDAYCVWDWDLRDRNVQYLKSLGPHYFNYVAGANYAHLDAEGPEERRRAATAIRAAYHDGLESFFAHL